MRTETSNTLRNFSSLGLVLLVIGLILGCSLMDALGESQESVREFHALLNQGNFEAIYEKSSPQLKSSIDKTEFINTLRGLKNKFGNVESTSSTGHEANRKNALTIVKLQYETTFSKGKAKEEFEFRIEGDEPPKLLNYELKPIR